MQDLALVSKDSLVSGTYFRHFEIYSDGKRVFAANDVVVNRDTLWGLSVCRQGEELPLWSDDNSPCDIHISQEYNLLTIGY